MLPSEIAKSYDQIADRWRSDSFPSSNGIAQHERAIAFLKQKHAALDIGCGSSGRVIDLLLRHGFAVEGVDISQRMLDLAQARHPNVICHGQRGEIRKRYGEGQEDQLGALGLLT